MLQGLLDNIILIDRCVGLIRNNKTITDFNNPCGIFSDIMVMCDQDDSVTFGIQLT
ncbi:Uncharacterised protein [Mycobacteroides abscessus subsp. abscessus]|nr:Uncharacterised protein [Mycobacteroides abscessus subsp. abscessus]